VYGPGERLPTEQELAKKYGYSQTTIREALKLLRQAGRVESRQGLGSFVSTPRRRERRSRHRYGRARRDQKLLTSSLHHQITFAGPGPAPAHIAELLGLPEGEQVVVVRRRALRDDDGALQELGVSYLPMEVAGGTFLEEPTVVPKALFLCVEELTGRRYTSARDEWIPRPAEPQEAQAFDMPLSEWVLHLRTIARDENGKILEISESLWPAKRVKVVDEYAIPHEPENPDTVSEI
jgi:GntR family transcriptional regulator